MFDDDKIQYTVVTNDEAQYSIWPAASQPPVGWTAVGAPRSRQACLDYIDEIWTDMRPRSLREAMDQLEPTS